MHRNPALHTWTASVVLSLTALSSGAFAAGFTPGNLVIARVGDGSAALTSAATATFLDEFTTTTTGVGVPVQTIALPETATGGTLPTSGNFSLSNSGSATSEGLINLSPNGQYITLGGYNTAVGTASAVNQLPNPATGANLRVVGIVNTATGAVDTSIGIATNTTSTGGYYVSSATVGNNIRDAVTTDGAGVYTAGATVSPQLGVAYTASNTLGNSVGISSTALNTRAVGINNNNLYFTTGSATPGVGLYRVTGPNSDGSGLPTTASAPVAVALTPPSTGTPNSIDPYDFLFSGNALYVASLNPSTANTTKLKGILKYTTSDSGLSYTYDYTIGTTGVQSLTGIVSTDGQETLYATTGTAVLTVTDSLGNTDPAAAATPTTLFTAGTNEAFRGIRVIPTPVIAPEPGSLVVTLLGMGMLGGLIAVRRRMSMSDTKS